MMGLRVRASVGSAGFLLLFLFYQNFILFYFFIYLIHKQFNIILANDPQSNTTIWKKSIKYYLYSPKTINTKDSAQPIPPYTTTLLILPPMPSKNDEDQSPHHSPLQKPKQNKLLFAIPATANTLR